MGNIYRHIRLFPLVAATGVLSVPAYTAQYDAGLTLSSVNESAVAVSSFDQWYGLALFDLAFVHDANGNLFTMDLELLGRTEPYQQLDDGGTTSDFTDDQLVDGEQYKFQIDNAVYSRQGFRVGQVGSNLPTAAAIHGMDEHLDYTVDYGLRYSEMAYSIQVGQGVSYEDDDQDNQYLLTGSGSGRLKSDYSLSVSFGQGLDAFDWQGDIQIAGFDADSAFQQGYFIGTEVIYPVPNLVDITGVFNAGRSLLTGEDEQSLAIRGDYSDLPGIPLYAEIVANTGTSDRVAVGGRFADYNLDLYAFKDDGDEATLGAAWYAEIPFTVLEVVYELSHHSFNGESRFASIDIDYTVAANMQFEYNYLRRHEEAGVSSEQTKAGVQYSWGPLNTLGFSYERDTGFSKGLDDDDRSFHGVSLWYRKRLTNMTDS